ncbi:MAG: DUF1902 domain-containing protein [Alphaproteobacteria bacterium]|nr:DUF1902 domain-containing protein [Alphaproteobacteria bacterium]
MQASVIKVQATWDGEAKVWVAESDDVPGLVTEAATVEALIAKLRVQIPELIEENNGLAPCDIPFDVVCSGIAHAAE